MVTEITNSIIQARSDKVGTFNCCIEEYEPIPITEEWLIKFGFEKRKDWDDGLWFDIDSSLLFSLHYYRYELKLRSAQDNLLLNIKSIHQLQNFIYILTGEELTIPK
jgi:hypothetical protein